MTWSVLEMRLFLLITCRLMAVQIVLSCSNHFRLRLLSQLQSEESLELQHIMQEMSKMFGGRRRGSEWSVPWPYKGRTVYNLAHLQYMIFPPGWDRSPFQAALRLSFSDFPDSSSFFIILTDFRPLQPHTSRFTSEDWVLPFIVCSNLVILYGTVMSYLIL